MSAAAELGAVASAARRFGTEYLRAASKLVEDEIIKQLNADTGGNGALSNAPKLKAASTRVRITSDAAYIRNAGSKVIWAWLEEGTGAHTIRRKRRAGRGRRGRALRTPYGPRASVSVRGMTAKNTWTKGSEAGVELAEREAVVQFEKGLG